MRNGVNACCASAGFHQLVYPVFLLISFLSFEVPAEWEKLHG